jgi:pyridinium-3,5-biscarboxylic acid mononucleotide sulfurtransferase
MNAELVDEKLRAKEMRLSEQIRSYGRVAVAFSGGIDSTLVAAAAYRAIQENAVAITADSPSVPRSEIEMATQLAGQLGIRHLILKTEEFSNPDYLRNDGARCYFCKSELYDTIAKHLPELGIDVICSGANLDDLGDYRPGLSAAAERGIRHPLIEAEFTKADVRQLAKAWGLPTWDKPASPCLSSRIAPGVAVTIERTHRIEVAEKYLKSLGIHDCRVRLHDGELARIEVPLEGIMKLTEADTRDRLVVEFKTFGFKFVTIDLLGLQTGSLNQLVDLEVKSRFAMHGEKR